MIKQSKYIDISTKKKLERYITECEEYLDIL